MLKSLHGARPSEHDESGYALLMVIASVLIMTILGATALAVATQQQKLSRRDQDTNGAYQAAESGIDDYLARLQANPNYWTSGNSDATNAAFAAPTAVPGSASGATFQYSINTSNALSAGYLTLTSTGRVNGRSRTLTSRMVKSSFLDYMYFTKYETIDPVAYAAVPPTDSTTGSSVCAKYAYTTSAQPSPRPTPSGSNAYCANISFASSDTLRGPVYSQDRIQLNGSPTFNSTFSTGWNDPAGKYYSCLAGATCNPSFASNPTQSLVDFPSTNTGLRGYADVTQGGTGCVFTGPTSIVFNSDGTMTVTSPYTSPTKSTGACGTHNWTSATTVSVPSGSVVWVDANSTSCSTMPASFPYPVAADASSADNPIKLRPTCANGDAYVSGWLKGQVTVGTVNNIYITNDVRYVGSNTNPTAGNLAAGVPTSATSVPTADTNGTDVLGLAAANFVQVYHPLVSNTANVTTSPYPLTNLQVDATIVASSDSFLVEDWDKGPALGYLSIKGGIIQNYRGPVATSSGTTIASGYNKNYEYDTRLHTLSPPHLADLASSAWVNVAQGEGPAK